MRWSIKEHLQTPSVSIYTETDALYIHIQVSPPTLEISCPVPPWPMPELQNCRNIAYYLARCGKRITGNPTITKYLYPRVIIRALAATSHHVQVTQITVPSINHTIWIYRQSWDRNLFLSRSATVHHMGEAMPPAAARQPKDVVTWVIATMQLCNSANAGECNCRVTARWQAVMTAPEDRNCDSFAEFGVWTSILQIQQLHSFHNLKGQVSKFQTERQCLNAHL